MILTPVAPESVPAILAHFAARVAGHPAAAAAFARIRATWPVADGGVDTPDQRAAAVHLARRFGIPTRDEAPQFAFSWDGVCIRTRSEASVIVHEVTHWLVCPPERRALYDFGLGAGPETGRRADADAAACVDAAARQQEECLASLLGILWEAELGQPAILAFLEQNWLEAWSRPAAADHFIATIEALVQLGLVDDQGCAVVPPPGPAATAGLKHLT
ncbi:MAG: hypothetical protein GC191_02960 [Azospirillum sp.]|nr:hypothetical protein [Azospirillum sp.]